MIKQIFHHGKNSGRADFCRTKIENFSVKFGGFTVFENLNLNINCGELIFIIGPNGGGKSTFLKAILGEIPHGGSLSFVDAEGKNADAPIIGYVPQQLFFDKNAPISVSDLFGAALGDFPIWLGQRKSTLDKIKKALSKAKAEHLIDKRLGALSGGELQRALLALSLEPTPNLLLLDEPISGVDVYGRELFYETVTNLRESEDMAILLVSHDLDMAKKYANRVLFLNRSVKALGAPQEVFDGEVFGKV